MARRLRIQFAGAVYHVMARGNERREIFRDDRDRERFLETLEQAVAQFGLRLHAYCLMPNHYHLLLGTPRANLSRAMGWLQTTNTARFNARYHRRGHLFQGRYKAQLVEADEYARGLVEYIHLNPVRPRGRNQPITRERLQELAAYRWSSHRDYAGLRRMAPEWLNLDWLAYWGSQRRAAQRHYREAIRHWAGRQMSSPWQQLRGALVLGGEEFYQKACTLVGKGTGNEAARWTRCEETEQTSHRVQRLVAAEDDDRVKLWARIRLGAESGAALGREYGYADSSGITQVLKRLEARAGKDRALARRLEHLRKMSIVND